jgi:hypothetical protein
MATIDKVCKEEGNSFILFDPDIVKGLFKRGWSTSMSLFILMTVLKVSCIFLEFIFVYVFVKGIDIISFLYLKFHVMIHYLKHTFVPKIVDKLFLPLSLSQLTLILLLLVSVIHPMCQ